MAECTTDIIFSPLFASLSSLRIFLELRYVLGHPKTLRRISRRKFAQEEASYQITARGLRDLARPKMDAKSMGKGKSRTITQSIGRRSLSSGYDGWSLKRRTMAKTGPARGENRA